MFTNRVREIRLEKGMSQSYLARMVGVAEPNLSQIERGQRAPWPKLKREIAQVLKISQEEIFPEVPNE